MNYLLIALVVTIVLLVLYLVARKVKPFGQALAFVCTVASRVNVKIAEYMSHAAAYFHSACIASLHYPPGVSDSDYWSGINVLSRLVYFMLAILILAGETVNTLLVLPSLFHTATHIQLPGMIEFASAALFICCPALFGAVMLECCGLIPHGAGLFPHMNKITRWVLGVLSGVFLILAVLLTGYFYLFRAAYLVDPESTQGMSLYILGGLGLLIAAVSVLALWALVVGGAGVASLLLWVGEKACMAVAGAASLLPELLDVFALHLSGGTIGVGGIQIDREPHKYPTFPSATSHVLLPGQTISSTLVEPVSTRDAETDEVIPVEIKELENIPMSHPDKNASFVFVGSFGSQMFPPVAQKIAALHAQDCIRTSLYLDLSITHIQTALPGIVDLSPTHVQRQAALLHSETEGQAYHTLLSGLADRLVETHLETKASPAPLIFVIDCRALVDAVDMLEAIKRRLPLHSLVVVTSLSTLDVQNKTVQMGIADMQSLHAEDFIETVFVTDPRSPFAILNGEETQHHFLAQTLVSLVIAHKHSLHNRSFTNVLHELHSLSPFTAVSAASEAVAIGSMPKRWVWVPGTSGQAGTGNYGDILAQTRVAIERVVTEEETGTFPSQVSTDAPCTILNCVPITLNDSRHAECVRDNALYVASHYPSATSLTVRGNGCAYPHHNGGRFLVQAACLYPLAPVSLLQMHEGKQVKVTPLYPVTTTRETTSGNGHVPEQENNVGPDITKAVTTTGQKKSAAPSRRVGRKDTKMAK